MRAQHAGIVKALSVKNGDTLPIGAPILTLETSGAGASAAPALAASPPSAGSAAPSPAAVLTSHGAAHHDGGNGRAASIHFRYGKRDAVPPRPAAGARPAAASSAAPISPAKGGAGSAAGSALPTFAPSKAGGRTYLDLPPAYGRPGLGPQEIAAIDSGGVL